MLEYEIVPRDDTVLVTVTDGGVSEQLDMGETLPVGSMLVQQSRTDVLDQIGLEKMLSNLDNCVDLLQITCNAVDGFTVQSYVMNLSNRFMDAMGTSNAAALDFKLSAEEALDSCIYAYAFLIEGEVKTALELLSSTKNAAKRMVTLSDELVSTYQELTDYTNIVLRDVIDERPVDEEKREKTKAMIGELEDSVQAMEELKEKLSSDIQKMNEEYRELQAREIQESKQMSGLQLASLIVGVLGNTVGIPFQVLAGGGADRADALAERLKEIDKQREEFKALERKNMVELAQNTAKMKNMVTDANSLESAIQCLVIAIGCLRKVLAYLQEIKQFWMNVETFCSSLTNNGSLMALIGTKAKHPVEECGAYFKDKLFVRGYLGLMAKWRALYVVFDEYHTALGKVSQRMRDTMDQSLSADRKVQWELARKTANRLNQKLTQELGNL